MKNTLVYLGIVTLLFSCGAKKKLSTQNISGIWTEHWEPDTMDPDKSVDYVDTLKLYVKNNQLNIKCINNNYYVYSDIKVVGNQLTFTKENTVAPDEKFFVYYTLHMNKNHKEYNGDIVNSVNEHNKVSLKKME